MKKQENAEATEETIEQCMVRMKEANPDLTDEAARAMCEEQKKPKAPAENETEKSLRDQIIRVMKDYGELFFFWHHRP